MSRKSNQSEGSAKLQLKWLFAIPVFAKQIEDHLHHVDSLKEIILERWSNDPGIQRSNLNGWHSGTDLHLWEDEHVAWLTGAIERFALGSIGEFRRHTKMGPLNPEKVEVALSACWANVSGLGGWNGPHNHIPAAWSGIFYVSVEDAIVDAEKKGKGKEGGQRNNSGMLEFLNPMPIGRSFGGANSVMFEPKDGVMVLFPGVLQHLVHPNMSEVPRISIAFNIDINSV